MIGVGISSERKVCSHGLHLGWKRDGWPEAGRESLRDLNLQGFHWFPIVLAAAMTFCL